jgi:hypothetical protein
MNKNDQLDQLFQKWKSINNYQRFKSDGIIDEDLFIKAKKKILFIGKEANDPDGEDGDFRKWWNEEMTGGFSIRIGEWAYGILNDFPVFETIKRNQKWEALRSVSFMDVKKPAGGSSSIESEIIEYIKKDMDFIKEEIEIIDPEIIISFIGSKGNQLIFGEDWNTTGYHVNYLKSEKRLVIDFYHPSNQGGSTMNYVLLEKIIKIITDIS